MDASQVAAATRQGLSIGSISIMTQPRFNEESPADEASSHDDPVARLRLQLNELQAYFRQQWAARTDRMLLGVRRLAVLAVVGIVVLLAAAAWVVTAVVLLLHGAAGGLTLALGGRSWLASLIVGASAMALVAIGVAAIYGSWVAASRKRTRQKYEHRQREQQRQFGHSARERATL